MAVLDQGKSVRGLGLDEDEQALVKSYCFITAKRAMYVGNVADDGFTNNPLLDRLTEFAAARNAPVVAICAAIESEIVDLDDADRLLHDRRQWRQRQSVAGRHRVRPRRLVDELVHGEPHQEQ